MGGGGAEVSAEEEGVGGRGGVVVEVGGLVGGEGFAVVGVVRGEGGVSVQTRGRSEDSEEVVGNRGGWRERGGRKACIVLKCGLWFGCGLVVIVWSVGRVGGVKLLFAGTKKMAREAIWIIVGGIRRGNRTEVRPGNKNAAGRGRYR